MPFGMEKTMAKKRMTKKERMRQRRRRQRMMFGGGLLLVAVVFTVILLLLGSKGCGTSKAEGDEVEAVPSAEATVCPKSCPRAIASVRSSFSRNARAMLLAICETSSVCVSRVR